MAVFALTLLIDSTIINEQPNDNLNIAKKVNGVFTTTFHGASINPVKSQQELLQVNPFQWTEEYAVLLAVDYEAGMQLSAATLPQPIKFGQKVTYDKGNLEPAEIAELNLFTKTSAENSFVLCNVPDNLKASVSCKVGGTWKPIYVDNARHSGVMNKELTPVNEYSLFWDSEVASPAMIDYSKSADPYEFSFPGNSRNLVLRWGYKVPDQRAGVEQPQWYPASLPAGRS